MECLLTDKEIRVLGALMEKEMTTPDYYPLSLNALTNACNQKSSRDPVVSYEEKTVSAVLAELMQKQLVWRSDAGRVPKYGENLIKNNKLLNREAALLCLLFLRGPQTLGELRGRAERLYRFDDLGAVGRTLGNLQEIGFVREITRQSGHKESRYTHLLAGDPVILTGNSSTEAALVVPKVMSDEEKFARLEKELQILRRDFKQLQQNFFDFKKQFE